MADTEHLLRPGTVADIPAIEQLILVHGANEWNYLPETEVKQHVGGIALGTTFAVISEIQGLAIGVITYEVGHYFPYYQPEGRQRVRHGYVAEAAVHRSHVGRGIGTALLRAAIQDLTEEKAVREIYAKRHADNVPSARMMEKSGMVLVAEFDDPEIRLFGSRRTAVMRYSM